MPPAALKLAWPVIGTAVVLLYQRSLSAGWHPTPFRRATMCVIQKPAKKDKSSPRAYRLIALLSTLGKGLEHIVARRLAHEAVSRRLIPPGYHGVVPQRSACDLVLELSAQTDRAVAEGQVISVLTFDVKGAFDAVLPGRMVQRLLQQSWSTHVVG